MTIEYLMQNWALVVASILGTAVLFIVLFRVFQDSAQGRLQANVRQLRNRERAAQTAARAVEKATARLEQLRSKADAVKPRHAEEAKKTLGDARELQKIVDSQVLVARNNVRTLILEEYPPKRHEAMRNKYLAE